MKNSPFKGEDIFGNKIGNDSVSPEQTTKPNNFSAKLKSILIFV